MLLDKLFKKNYLFSCVVSLNFNHLPRRKLSEKIGENQAYELLKYIKDDLKVQQKPFSRVKYVSLRNKASNSKSLQFLSTYNLTNSRHCS